MTRKIYVVRTRTIKIDINKDIHLRMWVEHFESVEHHVELRYVTKETEKCLWVSSHDDNDGYRQLKADLTYFDDQRSALLEVERRLKIVIERLHMWAEAAHAADRHVVRMLNNG